MVDADLDNFRLVTERIYKSVLDSYKEKNGLIFQINLTMSNLKKQWIRSGLFNPLDPASSGMPSFLVNELG